MGVTSGKEAQGRHAQADAGRSIHGWRRLQLCSPRPWPSPQPPHHFLVLPFWCCSLPVREPIITIHPVQYYCTPYCAEYSNNNDSCPPWPA